MNTNQTHMNTIAYFTDFSFPRVALFALKNESDPDKQHFEAMRQSKEWDTVSNKRDPRGLCVLVEPAGAMPITHDGEYPRWRSDDNFWIPEEIVDQHDGHVSWDSWRGCFLLEMSRVTSTDIAIALQEMGHQVEETRLWQRLGELSW